MADAADEINRDEQAGSQTLEAELFALVASGCESSSRCGDICRLCWKRR
jgi:hypothetical protein